MGRCSRAAVCDFSASDYIRDLLRQGQDRAAERRWLQAEIKGRACPIDPAQ